MEKPNLLSEPQSVWRLFVQRVMFTLSIIPSKKATSTRKITTPVYPGAANVPHQVLLFLRAFTAWTAEAPDAGNPPVLPSPVHHTAFSDRILFSPWVRWKANKNYTIFTLSEIPSK